MRQPAFKGAGGLRERVAFDAEDMTPDGSGGEDRTWREVYACAAEFRYERGAEAAQAGALTGTARFKLRVRSCDATRALTARHRVRDVRRGVIYNLREIDAVTDRSWVWIGIEGGVAV